MAPRQVGRNRNFVLEKEMVGLDLDSWIVFPDSPSVPARLDFRFKVKSLIQMGPSSLGNSFPKPNQFLPRSRRPLQARLFVCCLSKRQ